LGFHLLQAKSKSRDTLSSNIALKFLALIPLIVFSGVNLTVHAFFLAVVLISEFLLVFAVSLRLHLG
jgi:hypothetical protein